MRRDRPDSGFRRSLSSGRPRAGPGGPHGMIAWRATARRPLPIGKFLHPCRNAAAPNVIVPAEHDARPKPVKETTMQYTLMIYGNEAGMQSASKADAERMLAAYG